MEMIDWDSLLGKLVVFQEYIIDHEERKKRATPIEAEVMKVTDRYVMLGEWWYRKCDITGVDVIGEK